MKPVRIFCIILVCSILSTCPAYAQADENIDHSQLDVLKPLWELGVFGGAARLPHYRGSDESRMYVLPLPFLIYRGRHFQTDRDGARGLFYRSDRFEWDISLSGNPPVPDDNRAREGMRELDPIVEIGPALKWYPAGRQGSTDLYLSAALRSTFSINLPHSLKTRYEGLKSTLGVTFKNYAPWGDSDWQAGTSFAIDFSDHRYNGYFYTVDDEDARPDRESYHAPGGYAGWSISGSLLRKLGESFSLGSYLQYTNLAGSAYADSPLVKTQNNIVVGAALIWTFAKSERRVRP